MNCAGGSFHLSDLLSTRPPAGRLLLFWYICHNRRIKPLSRTHREEGRIPMPDTVGGCRQWPFMASPQGTGFATQGKRASRETKRSWEC